jgi:hypothetical protein
MERIDLLRVQVPRNGFLVQWDFRSGQMYENKTSQDLGPFILSPYKVSG